MKAGGGKGKGGGYERIVGTKLSLWISHGQRKDLLCRTVGSGAQFTTAAKKSISAGHAGDLMSQDPLSYELCKQICIECKFWKNLNFVQFLDEKGDLYKALQKVRKEAINVKKEYWLIVKQNHQKDLLMMRPKEIYSDFLKDASSPRFHSIFSGTVTVYYLEEFLSKIDPEKYLLV